MDIATGVAAPRAPIRRRGLLTGAELRAGRDVTVDLRLPAREGGPVLTDHGRLVAAAAPPGDARRFRVRLSAGGRYRLSYPGPDIGH
ncbi:hypothetical protein OG535_05360 [Kitasatospora sp. NBC_00085]|uniref:hypothetical protein n=1 Tax=unclassified Kitasatospora TaxID=2633591 RepID=UPI0032536A56